MLAPLHVCLQQLHQHTAAGMLITKEPLAVKADVEAGMGHILGSKSLDSPLKASTWSQWSTGSSSTADDMEVQSVAAAELTPFHA